MARLLLIADGALTGEEGRLKAEGLRGCLPTEAVGPKGKVGALDLDDDLPTELVCPLKRLDGGIGPLSIECLDFKLSSASPLMLLGGSFVLLFSLSPSTFPSRASFNILSRQCCRLISSFFSSSIFFF
eukprot:CAMPEP_0196232390 /NCGR_PEP_ID=MMETSP0913-20130531/3029_1 /TAXON_ID=49265 /ORGANISM="Thalassiosira rotula, Strain GSO102" /LENGTH=127 /DNA_ID=CAMNT_0041512875 /DNA_START=94 /DNA_END=474 /DNA_ORIENTATION=-